MNIHFTVPDSAPKRGNALTKLLAEWSLRATGWQLTGEFPAEPKFVAIVAPHRSAWDLALGMMSLYGMQVKFSWMAKHSVFFWPIDGILRWLGGIPINRSAAHGIVPQLVNEFAQQDKLILAITPEGTRTNADSPVSAWKKGFYHIAHRSRVPILPIYLAYEHKIIYFGPLLRTSGNVSADLIDIQEFYSQQRHRFDGVA